MEAAGSGDRPSSVRVASGGQMRTFLDAETTLAAIDAKFGTENFPVALAILPKDVRRHLRAIYGFARLVDDVGDEAPGGGPERIALLDAVDDDIDRLVGTGVPTSSVLRRLAPTVRELRLPLDPFHRLVAANRLDQTVTRYSTYPQLLDYCALSANPVGYLVLAVFGQVTPQRVVLSGDVCTALQLLEHIQDVAEDARRGRVYLPESDLERFNVTVADLTTEPTPRRLRQLLALQVARAQARLTRGAALVSTLHGPARIAVAGFVGGGQAALDSVAAADFAVTTGAPRASTIGTARAVARVLAHPPRLPSAAPTASAADTR